MTGVDIEVNTPDIDRDRIRINAIKLHFITKPELFKLFARNGFRNHQLSERAM